MNTNLANSPSVAVKAKADPRSRSGIGLRAVMALWLVLSVTGMAWLANYENAPGVPAQPQATWPAHSRLRPNASGSTLVMFAHPQCPCTRASIRELSGIMARCHSSLRAVIFFTQPAGFDRGWVQSDLWEQASSIPGVSVKPDPTGAEARAFGVQTSGQALLYDQAGALQFHGGITPSRGHSGDNLGRNAVLAHVRRGAGTKAAADSAAGFAARKCFVFGCPLFRESQFDDSE